MATGSALVVAINGVPVTNGVAYAGGGVIYWEDAFTAMGIDVNSVEVATADMSLYIDRNESCAKYRGKALPRSKHYINNSRSKDDLKGYKFPGFQYACMLKYKDISDPEVAYAVPFFNALQNHVTFNGVGHQFTQAITTRYMSGADNITMHSDRMTSIEDDSIIVDFSIGAERTLQFQNIATGKLESIRMASGSAIIMTTAANVTHKHAVPPEPGAGPRVSIVFRNINQTYERAAVVARVAKAAAVKARRAADNATRVVKARCDSGPGPDASVCGCCGVGAAACGAGA